MPILMAIGEIWRQFQSEFVIGSMTIVPQSFHILEMLIII